MRHHLSRHKKKKIRIARTRDLAILLLAAEQNGHLSKVGAKIEYVDVPYARKGMELLAEGSVDMAIMAEIVFAYMPFYELKEPIKAIASLEKRQADNILIKKKNASPDDLKGKKIGFTPRTTSHSFLFLFLQEHKISRKDVKLVPLSPQAMPNAFIQGTIDAMSLWQPYIHNTLIAMNELGLPYTHFNNTNLYTSEVILAATKSLLVKNTHIITNILKGLKASESELKNNPDRIYTALTTKMRVGNNSTDIFKFYSPELSLISNNFLSNINYLSNFIIETDTQYKGHNQPDYMDYIDNRIILDIIS